MSEAGEAKREDAVAIVQRLREAGHVAYFAGGCVRDMLLGLEPNDYDVATDAPPDRVRQLFSNTQAVGAAFGVILVRQRKSQIEVATFRTDLKYVDGRRPEGVVFTTAEEDAKRRDFTINGIFYDPVDYRVIDFVGGQEDLHDKLLRAIGNPDERFEEDHLRLLRAVRFAARFGLTVEHNTARAIENHAEQLKRISPERIAEELRLMLTPATRVDAWRMLWEFKLIQVILRTLFERPETMPHDRWPLFIELAPRQLVPFGLALAALVLCYRIAGRTAKPIVTLLEEPEVRRSVQACRTTLKISNEEADLMHDCLLLAPLLQSAEPTVAFMKRFLAKPASHEARALLEALALSEKTLRHRSQWLSNQFAELSRGEVAPPPLITGDDLTAAGLTPGPMFKRVLDAVYDAQLEDRVQSKEQAMELAKELVRGMGF